MLLNLVELCLLILLGLLPHLILQWGPAENELEMNLSERLKSDFTMRTLSAYALGIYLLREMFLFFTKFCVSY